MAEEAPQILTLEGANKEYKLDASGCATYGELRASLSMDQIEHLDYCVFWNEQKGVLLKEDQEIHFEQDADTLVALKYRSIEVEVHDRGSTHTFKVPMNCQLAQLKVLYHETETRKHLMLDTDLSYKGVDYKDGHTLLDAAIFTSGQTLVGRRRVIVSDLLCDLDTLIEVKDSELLRDVTRDYCVEAKREFHENFDNNLTGEEPTLSVEDGKTSQNDTVYQAFEVYHDIVGDDDVDMNDNSGHVDYAQQLKLLFTTPKFPVTLVDRLDDTSTTIMVHDSDRIEAVKALFGQESVSEGLVAGDKLMLRNVDLDDRKMVVKYRLNSKTVINIEREDLTQTVTVYICSDCGCDVPLKQKDTVRCRQCGNMIVYKKRTTAPCQHLAR